MLFGSNEASGREWHLEADGSGDAPSLVAVADSVSDGDIISLGGGVYEDVGVVRINDVSVSILGDPESVPILSDCQLYVIDVGSFRVVALDFRDESAIGVLRASELVLTDVTYEDNSFPVLINGCERIDIDDCTFRNNHYPRENQFSAALHVSYSTIEVRNCTFENNRAPNTGSVMDETSSGGGAIRTNRHTKILVENCLFLENEAISASAAYLRGEIIFRYNTVVRNRDTSGAVVLDPRSGEYADAYGNIFYENEGYGLFFSENDTGVEGQRCNCFWENKGSGGFHDNFGQWWGYNFDDLEVYLVDPVFCPEGGFQLDESSPLSSENREGPEFECDDQIGAFGVGCTVEPTKTTSWGALKELLGR